MPVRSILAVAALALLAACGDKPSENDSRSASGEVLEGTISDAMLPLDTVRSQPPLAEPETAARASAAATDAAVAGEATEAPPEGEATPAAEPTAEAE
ncbi:MAG: hypothetical protein ACM3YM_02985 [Sphingomonadales bacterium]